MYVLIEEVTKARRVRKRNRCVRCCVKSYSAVRPHLPQLVIEKVTMDIEKQS